MTKQWWAAVTPNQLGEDHWYGWLKEKDGGINILYLHNCNGKMQLGLIELASGLHHKLINKDPLHIEASVLCLACGDHGFIRSGKWVSV